MGSKPKRGGIDIDGCLSNFVEAHVDLIIRETDRNLFGPALETPDFPPCWNYPQFFGYSNEEDSRVWKVISGSPTFWSGLQPVSRDEMDRVAMKINTARLRGHEFTFITSRPGATAKRQTEDWLIRWGVYNPTVLVRSNKGYVADALDLDFYIDDRLLNCLDVNEITGGDCRVYLLDAPYNQVEQGRTRDEADPPFRIVKSVLECLEKEGF